MKYDFDRLPDRRGTESEKWNAYEADVLPMWVADMDFTSPQPVIDALHARVAHGVFGYPVGIGGSPKELAGLRGLLVERMQRLYGWTVQPEDLLFVPGVVSALNVVTHALVPSEGSVLIQTPVYPPFLHLGENASVRLDQVPLALDPQTGRYSVDGKAFEAAITPETRLFVLCNPHNPVGRVFRREELTSLAEACLRHDVWICSDEIHSDLVFNGCRHVPLASLSPEVAQRTITIIAPSKTYNLAGLECSVAIIPNRELRKKFREAGQGMAGWVNLMGLVAAEAAYRDGQEWLDQLLVYLQGNRNFLYETLRSELPGIRMVPPEATYLAWLDCRGLGLDQDPYNFFLEKARVALSNGAVFGPGGEGFVRLNFGCPRSMLAEALDRMLRAVRNK